METPSVERYGRIADLDRSFDLQYWKARTPTERMAAVWEMVLHVDKIKGLNVCQSGLQRSVETFQRQQR